VKMVKGFVLALALSLLGPCSGCLADVYIKVFPKASSVSDEVMLGDIADIDIVNSRYALGSIDAIDVSRLVENSGNSGNLRLNRLRELLRVELPNERIIIAGNPSVQISRIHNVVEGLAIENFAKEAIFRKYSGRDYRLNVSSIGAVSKIALSSKRQYELKARFSGEDLSKRMCVFVDVLQAGMAVTSVPVWLDVTATGMAYVAIYDLKKNQAINVDDFKMKEVDLAKHSNAIQTRESFDAAVVNTRVSQGDVITQRMIRKRPAVVADSEIWAIAKVGGIEVRSLVKSMSDAVIGQLVEVQSSSSRKRFRGLVVGKNLVEVKSD